MCGILCILNIKNKNLDETKKQGFSHIRSLRHRGPDWGGVKFVTNYKKKLYSDGSVSSTTLRTHILFHERLSIVGVNSGAQPITVNNTSLSTNGEIYNHKELKDKYFKGKKFTTDSDCEIIAHLFNHFLDHQHYTLNDIPNKLDGQFAFVCVKENEDKILVARDHLGIVPLYYGIDLHGNVWFSSELKALHKVTITPREFPPGHCITSVGQLEDMFRYYNPNWWNGVIPSHWFYSAQTNDESKQSIRNLLTKAVKKRMMSDVPFGVLLSGGLDSSLIASIVAKEMDPRQIKTFAIGLEGSPDLIAAQKVADYLGTNHHPIIYSLDEGFYALHDVIYHLETYDITTIRAGTPMYLLARVIKAMGIKMVLSGEGADECFGGYLYFYKAPSNEEFFKETCRKLDDLHYYDVLRANKSTMAWGVEVRVPFLDKEFLNLVMNIDPELKRPVKDKQIEKHLLRSAFDVDTNKYLPDDVLWRQKEQFSDGVGYSWIDSLKQTCDLKISDHDFEIKKKHYKHNTPNTKEGCYYRMIFEQYFPWKCEELVPRDKTIACSSSVAAEWDEKWVGLSEASGRAVKDIHISKL